MPNGGGGAEEATTTKSRGSRGVGVGGGTLLWEAEDTHANPTSKGIKTSKDQATPKP